MRVQKCKESFLPSGSSQFRKEREATNMHTLVRGHGKCHGEDRHEHVRCGNTGYAPTSNGNEESFLEDGTVKLHLHEAICFSD